MILSWPTIVNLIVTDPFIECNNIKNYTDDEIVNEAKNNSYRVFPNRLTNKPLQPNLTDTHSANSRYVIFKLYSAISFGQMFKWQQLFLGSGTIRSKLAIIGPKFMETPNLSKGKYSRTNSSFNIF